MAGKEVHESAGSWDEQIALCLALIPLMIMLAGIAVATLARGRVDTTPAMWGYLLCAMLVPLVGLGWIIRKVSQPCRWWHWLIALLLALYWLGFFFQWSFVMPYAMLNRMSMGEMIREGIAR